MPFLDKIYYISYNLYMQNIKNSLIIIFAFYVATCSLSPKLIRERILENNNHVVRVGIIENYTFSDNKYIAVDIVFTDGGGLYLTFVNYRKLIDRSSYHIKRIGNFTFGVYEQWKNHENSTYTYNDGGTFYESFNMRAEWLEQELDIELRTIQDAINNYDILYEYISSLSYLDIRRDGYKEIMANELENYIPLKTELKTKDFLHKYYPFRIDWNDNYFDGFNGRRPDYNNNDRQRELLYFGW